MIAVQLIGLVVGLAAINMTYLYYKRAEFSKKELVAWLFVWLAFIFVMAFPKSLQPMVGLLGLTRAMDLIMIIAFIVLFFLAFHSYVVNKKQEQKLTKLVQELALKDLDKE